MTEPSVKADLLRYLIMYAEGGVYADIDVEAIRPLNRFIPDRYNVKDIDMVVGVEIPSTLPLHPYCPHFPRQETLTP
jgi:mannosyltransferase OCH1-like enzyme